MIQERTVLFWLFVSFFLVIGVVSLLAVVGVLKTDPRFRRWAVTGFIAGVTGAVIGLFKIIFAGEVALFVTLVPPPEVPIHTLDFEPEGEYTYRESVKSGSVKTQSGGVVVTLGNGGWQVTLPQEVLGKAVELRLKERNGNWWRVTSFQPSHNRQPLVKSAPPPQPTAGHSFERTPVGSVFAAAPGPARVKFNNYARPIGPLHGRTYYEWRVFLDEPRPVLNTIAEVEYLLHPTFPKPLQVERDPRNKFALETSGWGEFPILITIRYKDGRVENTSYHLDLSKGWPSK